jgi:hypothetical protein
MICFCFPRRKCAVSSRIFRSRTGSRGKELFGTASPLFVEASLRQLIEASKLLGQGVGTTTSLTAALELIASLEPENEEAASAMPEVQEATRAASPKIVLCRLFRAVVSDPRAAVFEVRQIVLGDSFPHYVQPASGLGFVGGGMEEILSLSVSICREISAASFVTVTSGKSGFSAQSFPEAGISEWQGPQVRPQKRTIPARPA